MSTDLDEMMERALTGRDDESSSQQLPSPDDQREYIKDNVVKCQREELIDIFRALVIDDQSHLIKKQNGRSVAINLKNVSDETIKRMYLNMFVILERNKSLVGI
jgi:hypothetical protein